MTTTFENPTNGYKVKVSGFWSFFWTSIIGPFYFLARGNIRHFFFGLFLALLVFPWLLYPFFAASILRTMHQERGYRIFEERAGIDSILIPAFVLVLLLIGIVVFVEHGTPNHFNKTLSQSGTAKQAPEEQRPPRTEAHETVLNTPTEVRDAGAIPKAVPLIPASPSPPGISLSASSPSAAASRTDVEQPGKVQERPSPSPSASTILPASPLPLSSPPVHSEGSTAATEAQPASKEYKNPRFGFVLSYPASLTSGPELENGDGREFQTANGEFNMVALGRMLRADQGDYLEECWQNELKSLGNTITYKKKNGTWYVVSGVTKDGVEYYHKLYTKNSHSVAFRITYPHAMAKVYDPWVESIARGFVP